MRRVFDANWLKDAELVPIVKGIYAFLDEFNTVPSLDSVAEYLQDKDKELYEARAKTVITELKMMEHDSSKQQYAIGKAKEMAASLSLQQLVHSADFQKAMTEGEGKQLMATMSRWLTNHTRSVGEDVVDIKTGIEELIKETPWTGKKPRCATGIRPIDEWCGGLRPGQLGIVIAPTGGGKSATLLNIAYNIAMEEGRDVLFLTNELTRGQQVERLLARMQGKEGDEPLIPLNVIQDDPVEAYKGLQHKWRHGLERRLWVGAIDLNTTAEEIESMIVHLKAQHGISPEVVIIDYMEKMKPSESVRRDRAEWIFMQEIAKELIRLGVRQKCHVWTAVQTNRQGLNKKLGPSMETTQGSVRHLQAANVVVSAQKVYIDILGAKVEAMHFKEWKMRDNEMANREMYIKTNLKVMYISDEEVVLPDDTEVIPADEEKEAREERQDEQAKSRGRKRVLSDYESKRGT